METFSMCFGTIGTFGPACQLVLAKDNSKATWAHSNAQKKMYT